MVRRSRLRGISLVEVLIAATVLGLMVVPLIAMFTLGNQSSTAAEHELQAALLAHEILERTRSETERWALGAARQVQIARIGPQVPSGFTYQLTTDPVGDQLYQVAVAVRWQDGRRARELKLASLVSLRPAHSERRMGATGDGSSRTRPGGRVPGFIGFGADP